MTFLIHALPPGTGQALFDAPPDMLEAAGACRVTADSQPGYPCRISLEDAPAGETLLLVNHAHRARGPYAARHAVFLRRDALPWQPQPGRVPEMLAGRTLSLRGFDDREMLRSARLVEGHDLAAALNDMLAMPELATIDIHFAAYGCFAARAARA